MSQTRCLPFLFVNTFREIEMTKEQRKRMKKERRNTRNKNRTTFSSRDRVIFSTQTLDNVIEVTDSVKSTSVTVKTLYSV